MRRRRPTRRCSPTSNNAGLAGVWRMVQPAGHSARKDPSTSIARQVIAAFEDFDHVVRPSGSCTDMIRAQYREAQADDPACLPRAEALAACTHDRRHVLRQVPVHCQRDRGRESIGHRGNRRRAALGSDLGCSMNTAGTLHRRGSTIRAFDATGGRGARRAAVLGVALWSIAETGSLVFHSGPGTAVLEHSLPLYHIAAVRARCILGHLEDYVAQAGPAAA